MIVLGEGEEIKRRYPAKINKFGKGTLYFTNGRIVFESDKHGVCFNLHFDNMFNWGRDKHHLYITWYEPEKGKRWTQDDQKFEVKIEIPKKKFNGEKLNTFDVALSLYLTYTWHYRYGIKSVGFYVDANVERGGVLRSHFNDIHEPWEVANDLKKNKDKLIVKDNDMTQVANIGVMYIMYDTMSPEPPNNDNWKTWKDDITKEPYVIPDQYHTLLYHDLYRTVAFRNAHQHDHTLDENLFPKWEGTVNHDVIEQRCEKFKNMARDTAWERRPDVELEYLQAQTSEARTRAIKELHKITYTARVEWLIAEAESAKDESVLDRVSLLADKSGCGTYRFGNDMMFGLRHEPITFRQAPAFMKRYSMYGQKLVDLINKKLEEKSLTNLPDCNTWLRVLLEAICKKWLENNDDGFDVWEPELHVPLSNMEQAKRRVQEHREKYLTEAV